MIRLRGGSTCEYAKSITNLYQALTGSVDRCSPSTPPAWSPNASCPDFTVVMFVVAVVVVVLP